MNMFAKGKILSGRTCIPLFIPTLVNPSDLNFSIPLGDYICNFYESKFITIQ